MREYDLETLRDEVAMVLQKNVLFSGTIEENLRWGKKNATREELERACRLAPVSYTHLGVYKRQGFRPSGGMLCEADGTV